MSRFLTAQGGADHLSLSLKQFYALLGRRRRAGRPIRTHRLGRMLRFTADDLDAAMTVEQPRHLRVANGGR